MEKERTPDYKSVSNTYPLYVKPYVCLYESKTSHSPKSWYQYL